MLRKIIPIILLLSLPASAQWAIYGVSVPAPEQNDTFDNSVGVEGQYRIPLSSDLAFAGILGLSRWEADNYRMNSCRMNAKISGDVTDLTVGIGLLLDLDLGLPDGCRLQAEGTLKHHILSSDVDVDAYPRCLPSISNELDYDNLTTLGAALNLEIDLAEDATLLLGWGYQWDVGEEDVKLAGFKTPLRNGFEGAVMKIGGVFRTP